MGPARAIGKRYVTLPTVTTITANATPTSIRAADSTYFLDLAMLLIANSSAGGTLVTLNDGTSDCAVFYSPSGSTIGFTEQQLINLRQSNKNAAWTATLGTSTTSIYITAVFAKRN